MAAYCVPTEPPKPFTAEAGGLTGSVVVGPDGVPVLDEDTGDNTNSGTDIAGPVFVGAEPELPANHGDGPSSGSPDDSNPDNGDPNIINPNPVVDPTMNPAPTDDPDSTLIDTGEDGTIDPIEVDPEMEGGTFDNPSIIPIDPVDPTITIDPDTTDDGGIAGTIGGGTVDPINPVAQDLEDPITPSGGDQPASPPEDPEPAPQPTPAPEPAPPPDPGPNWTPEVPMGPFVD